MALLSYSEVSAIFYTIADTLHDLSPEQLSLCAQIVGLLNTPSAWSDYDEYADDIEALVADTLEKLMNGTPSPDPDIGMNSSIFVLLSDMTVNVGTALTYADVAGMPTGYVARTGSSANGDIIQFRRYLMAGNWEFRIAGQRFTDRPILKVQLNEADGTITFPLTVDLHGTLLTPHIVTGTFTLPESGYILIALISDGKNAASSSYNQRLSYMELHRVP